MVEKDFKKESHEWGNHCDTVLFNANWNNKEHDYEMKEATIRFPKRVECPRTTVKEKFRQYYRRCFRKAILRKKRSLLDIAVSHSRFLSRAKKEAHEYKIFPSGETSLVVAHRIFSEFNEEYTVATVLQEKQTVHLRLQLSWCSETLIVRMAAPRGLWTILALEEYGMNYFLLPIILS